MPWRGFRRGRYLRAPFGVNIIRWRYAYFLSCTYRSIYILPSRGIVSRLWTPKGFPARAGHLDGDVDPCAANSDRIFMCSTPSELPSGTDTTDPWVQWTIAWLTAHRLNRRRTTTSNTSLRWEPAFAPASIPEITRYQDISVTISQISTKWRHRQRARKAFAEVCWPVLPYSAKRMPTMAFTYSRVDCQRQAHQALDLLFTLSKIYWSTWPALVWWSIAFSSSASSLDLSTY